MNPKILKILIKLNRISAWLLLVLMVLYIISGYGLTGRFGINQLIRVKLASQLHTSFHLPLMIFFVMHSGISIYFALRRWGWIKDRSTTAE